MVATMSGLDHLQAQTPAQPPVDARPTPATVPHDSTVDSGVDVGSSSEFDQENSAAFALEAQDDTSEASTDEGYADSDASSFLSSILSEVRRGVEIEGRLYPSYGKHAYGMPIDEKELDRNDLQHHKYTLLLRDRLFIAPISDTTLNSANARILDLGTGTGIWAMDMADKYPLANILGVDIAATQPAFVPPNCTFEIDDIEEDWPYRPDHFDFIHGRDLMTAVRDWPRLIQQAYAHLKPGGWIQLASTIPGALSDDNTIPPTAATWNPAVSTMKLQRKWVRPSTRHAPGMPR
ncbi:hypothetical protein PTNB73_07595 [Pyrenophora teres f. teres]|nr:hypothetical protein PTNB73_07595 [Pyrenophora teres f. teres]